MSDYPPFVTPGPRHGFFAQPADTQKSTPDQPLIRVHGDILARTAKAILLRPRQKVRLNAYVNQLWIPISALSGKPPSKGTETASLTFPESLWLQGATRKPK